MSESYDRDFYAWANEQASLLRGGRLGEADIASPVAASSEVAVSARPPRRELGSKHQSAA
jgi:hypothetical protein